MTYYPTDEQGRVIVYRNDAGVCPCGEREIGGMVAIESDSLQRTDCIQYGDTLRDWRWSIENVVDITTFTVSQQFDSDVENSIVGPVDDWSPTGIVDGVGPVRSDEVGQGIAPKSTIDRVVSETYVPESAKKKESRPTMREVRRVLDRLIAQRDHFGCPQCDGSGGYYDSYGEPVQCQACGEYEAARALLARIPEDV